MEFQKTELKDAILIKPKVFEDNRGFFMETYSEKLFKENGIENNFIQDNHSMSIEKGVLRGLHFQEKPHSQAKLVRVTKGEVYDVIVDLREDSPTFKKWQSFELSAENKLMLFVPKGFVHGFCTLKENTEFIYKVDEFYSPESDSGIVWDDPELQVDWPIKKPILSDKDKNLKRYRDLKLNF